MTAAGAGTEATVIIKGHFYVLYGSRGKLACYLQQI